MSQGAAISGRATGRGRAKLGSVELPAVEKAVYPFGFFVDRSSAIQGLGGPIETPDPTYCFHTPYLDCGAGRAKFSVHLKAIHCADGELNIRILAAKPGFDAIAVGGRRFNLDGMAGADLDETIAFRVDDGVKYALYGFLTEPAPVRAGDLSITLSEIKIADDSRTSRDAHVVAPSAAFGTSAKLFLMEPPSIDYPSSQPFDLRQLELVRNSQQWRKVTSATADPIEAWKVYIALSGLKQAEMLTAKAEGLILGMNDIIELVAKQSGARVDTLPGDQFYDFVLGQSESLAHDDVSDFLNYMVDSLADGGWGMLFVPGPAGTPAGTLRNLVQQLGLSILSKGHELYQITVDPKLGWAPATLDDGCFMLQFKRRLSNRPTDSGS